MYVLLVMLSRYLFVFYIAYFFWLLVSGEKYFRQRAVIYLMHITAFAILAFDKNTPGVKQRELFIGLASLIVFVAAGEGVKRLYAESSRKLWNCTFFLMSVSIVMLTRLNTYLAERQLIWFFAGLAAVMCLPFFFKIIKKPERLRYIYLAVAVSLLVLVFFFGKEEYGAIIGISIGGLAFQPFEIAKLLFVFYLSAAFYNYAGFKNILVPTCAAAAVVLFEVYNRDLGGALIFFITYMMIMYAATGNFFTFVSGLSLASAAAVLAYRVFPHIRVRVAAWSNPWADPTNTGYQTVQGFFAIGTYGLLGSGLTLGYPHYISVVERDLIFAAICEEFGSLFGVFIILIYILIFYFCIKISLNAANKFYALLTSGIAVALAFQTFLILGGVVKLIPLTGVTLPLISYGGSSATVCLLMIGVVQIAGQKKI